MLFEETMFELNVGWFLVLGPLMVFWALLSYSRKKLAKALAYNDTSSSALTQVKYLTKQVITLK